MKVLLLADDFGGATLDPAGVWLSELARACRRRGHGLHVVCSADGESPGRSEPWPGLTLERADASMVDLAVADALAWDPDVVHVAAPGPFNSRVIEALGGYPVLLELHDHWPICPQFDLLRRPESRACDRHHPFEGCAVCAERERLASMKHRAAMVACAGAIVAHGETMRRRIAAGLGREVARLDYGVDTLRFAPGRTPAATPAIARLAAERHGGRVLWLGPPTAARGIERAIDLLVALSARRAGAELVIAGLDPDDPGRGTLLRDEARSLGLEAGLTLVPVVPSDDLPALMNACDVAIAPGLAPDPGGLFVMLAFACGLPVVAHATGELPALCAGHDGAVLADGADVGAFANAIVAVLGDPAGRERHADAARLAAIEQHDLERAVVALEALWERLASAQRRAQAA